MNDTMNCTHSIYTFEWSEFSDFEKNLMYGIIAVTILLILQSVCFIAYVLRVRLRRRKIKQRMKTKIDESINSVETVRYSQRPLKQPPDPEIYESLKDHDEAPPPPSIDTLPRKKVPLQKKLLTSAAGNLKDNELNDGQTNSLRPRLPLPHEVEAQELLHKSEFATMPRTPKPHKASPTMMQTLPSRQRSPFRIPHLNSPTATKPILPTHPMPPSGHHSSDSRSIHRIPMELPLTRSTPEPSVIPTSQREYQLNSPARIPQQANNPDIDNELLQKLRKRAALIPESSNTFNNQIKENSISRDTKKNFKPLPPTPRVSDYGWVENFDEIEPLEPINLYNI